MVEKRSFSFYKEDNGGEYKYDDGVERMLYVAGGIVQPRKALDENTTQQFTGIQFL